MKDDNGNWKLLAAMCVGGFAAILAIVIWHSF